jgi:diadenosine tetraphosphate (Ap4A) HIT family hydrolase
MPGNCPFCRLDPEAIRHSNAHAVAFLDLFPISEGHTLVIPRVHRPSIFDGPADEQSAIWRLVEKVRAELVRELQPDGFTIGVNDGEAAGQTVSHAHVHVVPRFRGDVPDPRGGIRWVIADRAPYWKAPT